MEDQETYPDILAPTSDKVLNIATKRLRDKTPFPFCVVFIKVDDLKLSSERGISVEV
jgi:hypothetical protein